MHREIASDSDQLERFRREARAVARLSHPHIVGVIDAGEDEQRPYIVLEYIEGETLKERIRRLGRLPIDEAIAYAIEIARALGCAHANHIVHRDIKPQNVLIDGEGSAKVTDFGIARSLQDEGLTADGRVLGTTDYVSPEQALGQEVEGQSDLYSLGVVLYEMLTGEVPFGGESQVAVAMKHVREDLPDVQTRRPEVSATLAAVLDRMTEKDVDRRYRGVETLVADLEEALTIETARSGHSTGEATAVLRTIPARSRQRLPLRVRFPVPLVAFVAVLVVGGAVLGVAALLLRDRTERGTGAGPIDAPVGTRVVSLARTSAHAYDPQGDGSEHDVDARLAVDREPGTIWTTETYQGGRITKPSAGTTAPGVGIYVDARPGVAATRMTILTPQPGWRATIYAAPAGKVPPGLDGDWTELAGGTIRGKEQRFRLDATRPYRYYLVWITKLPPGSGNVKIAEIALLAQKPG
jgi:serine/threonine-protein kinase